MTRTPAPPPASSQGESRLDRLFSLMLIISLAGHAMVLAAQLISLGWNRWATTPRHPAKLIYEQETAKDESQWAAEELHRVETRLREPHEPSRQLFQGSQTDGGAAGSGGGLPAIAPGSWTVIPQVGGDASTHPLTAVSASGSHAWSGAVDLTNVVEAAQGNPVLLSYFSAIREQIQRIANTQEWLPQGTSTEGVIYVGFVISRTGHIQSSSIVADRSAAYPLLRSAALRIIRSASPFPPFPPSFEESSKTIMVPIEFVRGSS